MSATYYVEGAEETKFGLDSEGRFDPHILSHQIATYGMQWARAKAAAELLEQTRLPYLSRLTNQARAQNPELSRKEAEDIAMASEDYRTHILEAIEARQRADIVKAKWEAVKALADGLRTAEASRRAERNSYTR